MARHNIDGNLAEDRVVDYLKSNGFLVIERNWKTKYCEIDIIAQKRNCLHFVEVKFRGTDSFGEGFDYITSNKIKQMAFAAQLWVSKNEYEGEFVLSAAQVDRHFKITFIDQV